MKNIKAILFTCDSRTLANLAGYEPRPPYDSTKPLEILGHPVQIWIELSKKTKG